MAEATIEQNLDITQSVIRKAIKAGADAADAVMFSTTDATVSRRLGKPETLERAESAALGLRVWVGQKQANISTSDTTTDSLQALIERAVAMAKAAPEDALSTLAPEALLARVLPDLDLFDANEPSTKAMLDACAAAEDTAMAVKGITNSEGADASYSASDIALATSHGFAGHYRASSFSLSASVIAGEGDKMERDYDFTVARHGSDMLKPEAIGRQAAERALARLGPRKVSTCQVPIVFDPRISKGLIGSFASAISGSAIARGTSFLKNKMGQAVFAPHVQIIDDPHIRRGLSSKPFDGEGVANRKSFLIKDGVLQQWLLDVRSANKLGLTPTGHAARGVGGPPSPSSTNLYMAKGSVSRDELIINIKQGFYVTESFGMGVNLVTGDYSQGASGFWIENGELAYPVSEVTIAGHLAAMFRELTPADDLVFRYGTNAPTLRIDGMTVAGA